MKFKLPRRFFKNKANLFIDWHDVFLKLSTCGFIYEVYNETMEPLKKDKKKIVLFIIAHKDFRDEEYFITREVLEREGISVETASSDTSSAVGVKGGEVNVDILFSSADPSQYDAITIVGGRGIRDYFDDASLHGLIKDFYNGDKVVTAICAAPVVLARAGVLKGKKATAWHTTSDMECPNILKEEGAIFVEDDIVADGNVITARDPESAAGFGRAIILAIS